MFPIISACICLLNLLCLVSCDHDEKHSFEESLNNLKKEMTQLETKTMQMAEEMKNQKMMMAKMASVIQTQSEKNDQLHSEVVQLKSKTCECHGNVTSDRTMGKRLLNQKVAFSVRLTRAISVVDGMTIVFDEKVTDFGNNYDTYSGIFRAPLSGVYVFTWTIGTHSDRNEETVLVKEGNTMAYSYSNSSDNDGAQVTNTVVIQVNAGDHVMIKTEAWSAKDDHIEHGRANTFSGWLLWAI